MSINHLINENGFKLNLYTQEIETSGLDVSNNLEVKGSTILDETEINTGLVVNGDISANTVGCNTLNTLEIKNSNTKLYEASAPSFVVLNPAHSSTIQSISQIKYMKEEYLRFSLDTSSYVSVLKIKVYFALTYLNTISSIMFFSLDITDIPSIYHNGAVIYNRGRGFLSNGQFREYNVDTSIINQFGVFFETFLPQAVTTPPSTSICECEFEIVQA